MIQMRSRILLLSSFYIAAQAVAGEYPLKIEKATSGGVTIVSARNEGYAPVRAVFGLDFPMNVTSDRQWPIEVVIPPRSIQQLGSLFPRTASAFMNYTITKHVTLGDPAANVELDHIYRIPFPSGALVQVKCGRIGECLHHNHASLRNAIDFEVATGQVIVAARSGTVIQKTDENPNSENEDFFVVQGVESRANSIRILHDDGSIGFYAHLYVGSARVREGMRVQAGQAIALAGQVAGRAQPFVHFAVLRNTGKQLVSVPIKFGDPGSARQLDPSRGGERAPVDGRGNAASMALPHTVQRSTSREGSTQPPREASAVRSSHHAQTASGERRIAGNAGRTHNGDEPFAHGTASAVGGESDVPWAAKLGLLGLMAIGAKQVLTGRRRPLPPPRQRVGPVPGSGGAAQDKSSSETAKPAIDPDPTQGRNGVAQAPAGENKPREQITMHLLGEIEWKRFEELVAEYFRLIACEATTHAFGADGGIDVEVKRKSTGNVTSR